MSARLRTLAATLFAATIALTGCAAPADSPAGPAPLVVTTNILGDVVERLVGDEAEVHVLMPPNADPHSFGLSARDGARLETAELIIANGLGLEEGVLRAVEAAEAQGTRVIEAGPLARPVTLPVEGSAHGQLDPHVWTDPTRMINIVDALGPALADAVPAHAAIISERTADYRAELVALDGWMAERFATIPAEDRTLVTTHHVFGYLAERYDLDVLGTVLPGASTLASPSSADLAELAATMRRADVGVIFAEYAHPERLTAVLADTTGLAVRIVPLFSESLTEPSGGAPNYLAMMRANTDAIVEALTTTPPAAPNKE